MKQLSSVPMRSSDHTIITGIVTKNEKSLFLFYHIYQPIVFRFIGRQISDKEIVSELTQDTLFECIERLRDFRQDCSLKTYICTIAKNKTIDHIRKKKIKNILFSALPREMVEHAAHILFDDEWEKKELAQKISLAMNMLPNDYRVILRLKYIEGYRVRAIAKQLSMSFKAVESMLYRARSAFIRHYRLV